jgi:2,4-dienoyl-CoA reductase (NADPH2)
MLSGVAYQEISDAGLHYRDADGEPKTLVCDNVIVCAGQESERELYADLQTGRVPVHLIGGAESAAELDAVRAIESATRLALSL